MSDFFGRVVQRTRSEVAIVRPVPQAVTAPDPGGAAWDEQVLVREAPPLVRSLRAAPPSSLIGAVAPPAHASPQVDPPAVRAEHAAPPSPAGAPEPVALDDGVRPFRDPGRQDARVVDGPPVPAEVVVVSRLVAAREAPGHAIEVAAPDGARPTSQVVRSEEEAYSPPPASPARVSASDAFLPTALAPANAQLAPAPSAPAPALAAPRADAPPSTRSGRVREPETRALHHERNTTVEVSIGRIEVRMPPRPRFADDTPRSPSPRHPAVGLAEYLRSRDGGASG